MAVLIHIAYIRPMPVDALGVVHDKNNPVTRIKDVGSTSTDPRVIPAIGNPNTNGYPAIDTYLALEANSGFVLRHLSNTMIVTYPAGS